MQCECRPLWFLEPHFFFPCEPRLPDSPVLLTGTTNNDISRRARSSSLLGPHMHWQFQIFEKNQPTSNDLGEDRHEWLRRPTRGSVVACSSALAIAVHMGAIVLSASSHIKFLVAAQRPCGIRRCQPMSSVRREHWTRGVMCIILSGWDRNRGYHRNIATG